MNQEGPMTPGRLPTHVSVRMPQSAISSRRAATRLRLLTAAAVIFAERGVHGATVEDICEAAGFTRGAFYSNFADKDELFFALQRQEKEKILGQVEKVISEGPIGDDGPGPSGSGEPSGAGSGDVIAQLVEHVLALQPMDRQSHLVNVEFTQYAIRNPAAARQLNRDDDEFRDRLVRLIEAGLLRAGRRLTVDPDDAVAVLIGTFQMSTEQALLQASADEPDRGLARRTLPMVIRALSEPISA